MLSMLKYNVSLTDAAKEEIRSHISYIRNSLLSWSYRKIQDELLDKIESLSTLPEIFPTYRGRKDIRFMRVRHYLILFKVDKRKKSVVVLHVMYGKRDLSSTDLWR